MAPYYYSYVQAFNKCAQSVLDVHNATSITGYALILHSKANELLYRARQNKISKELPHLQKDIMEAARRYIKKFLEKQRQEKLVSLTKLRFN